MAKLLILKILIPRGKMAGLTPEEAFVSTKYNQGIEAALCTRLFWYRLNKIGKPGGLESTDASQCNDRVVQLVIYLYARSWELPLPTIYMLLYTLQYTTSFLRTSYVDSELSYGGSINIPFQGIYQVNRGDIGLSLCISTFVVLFLKERRHTILLRYIILAEENTFLTLIFVQDTDLPLE